MLFLVPFSHHQILKEYRVSADKTAPIYIGAVFLCFICACSSFRAAILQRV